MFRPPGCTENTRRLFSILKKETVARLFHPEIRAGEPWKLYVFHQVIKFAESGQTHKWGIRECRRARRRSTKGRAKGAGEQTAAQEEAEGMICASGKGTLWGEKPEKDHVLSIHFSMKSITREFKIQKGSSHGHLPGSTHRVELVTSRDSLAWHFNHVHLSRNCIRRATVREPVLSAFFAGHWFLRNTGHVHASALAVCRLSGHGLLWTVNCLYYQGPSIVDLVFAHEGGPDTSALWRCSNSLRRFPRSLCCS
jgi:hypothetical protein